MIRTRLARWTVCVLLAPAVLVVGAGSTGSTVGAADPAPVNLLVSVTAEDLGGFDRVTFTFEAGPALPEILLAEYRRGPAVFGPSGLPVEPPIAGSAFLVVTLQGATGVNLFVDPAVQTYLGPTRFAAGLPNVAELVQLEDFEAVLSWAIGVNDSGVAAVVRVVGAPTRVEVDVPHGTRPVLARPTFTG